MRRSARRRTLAIEVHPDLRVVVRAPLRADERFIAARVAERGPWIQRTLERFRRRGHRAPRALSYLDGETHYVLGEPCRLRVSRAAVTGVQLTAGELHVALRGEPTAPRIRRALNAWYREQARRAVDEVIAERFGYFRSRGHACPAVSIRAMRTRWGSLIARQRMTLNVALIRAPRECLEYVVVHELCHLEHGGHGRAFHELMDQLLPDWRERRRQLESACSH